MTIVMKIQEFWELRKIMSNNSKFSGSTKAISGFRKYFDAVASLHDVMMIANELEKKGNSYLKVISLFIKIVLNC